MMIESLEIWILGRACGSQIVIENRRRDLKILWSDDDNLFDRNPKLFIEQTGLCFIHSMLVEYMGRAHSLHKLSSK